MKFIRCLVLYSIVSAFCSQAWGKCIKPVPPELPPDTADMGEMDKAGKDVSRYITEMKKYRECHMKIVSDADNDVAVVIEGWNKAVESFKKRNQDNDS